MRSARRSTTALPSRPVPPVTMIMNHSLLSMETSLRYHWKHSWPTATVAHVEDVQVDATPDENSRARMRAQIVEVAAGLLATGGRDAVSTRAVAAAAGTQAPTIYRLFRDKDGLLAAVLEYGFATYLAGKPPLDPAADPITDLRAGWDVHVGFGLVNPALFLLMYADTQPGRRPAAAEAGLAILRS